jgi:alanine or glycine:cation symporter, AGCS family
LGIAKDRFFLKLIAGLMKIKLSNFNPSQSGKVLKNPKIWSTSALLLAFLLFIPIKALAQQPQVETSDGFLSALNNSFTAIVKTLSGIFFFPIGGENGFPLIVLWLIAAGIFFTFRMGFINFRAFKHAIDVVKGKYDDPEDDGEVSHFQALSAALSGTVGLGNIAGVAVAIQLGGPGAMFWLTLSGLFGMTTKFVECTLGVKYRRVLEDGTILGGPAYYLTRGFARKGLGSLGRGLAILFALVTIPASLGAPNMFQSNQAYAAVVNIFPGLPNWLFGLILAIFTGIVILGGIKRIGAVAEKLVPTMAAIYAIACLWIILVNLPAVPGAIATVFREAFAPTAVAGGIIGTMVQGIRRATFSNEAGAGSAATAHSAARTDEPVREGIVALLEPFIDTICICNLTAIVIVLTGVYQNTNSQLDGVGLTNQAFASAIGWFPVVLSIAVLLFAFSTILSWSYYGVQAWTYLFGARRLVLFKILYLFFTFLGPIVSLSTVIDFSDMMFFAMAIPNLIGCYFLSNEVAADLKDYWHRLVSGQMLIYKSERAKTEVGISK